MLALIDHLDQLIPIVVALTAATTAVVRGEMRSRTVERRLEVFERDCVTHKGRAAQRTDEISQSLNHIKGKVERLDERTQWIKTTLARMEERQNGGSAAGGE